MTPVSDKRRHTRRTLAVTFRARDADGQGALELSGADVSAGGAFLVADVLLETGESLGLEFSLPGRTAPLRVRARVAWVRRFPAPAEPPGMGVEFVGLHPGERAALEAWVSASSG